MTTRTFSELDELDSLEERFRYLALRGRVGEETFGSDRWLNQQFYTSRSWKNVRDEVMIRDDGCELGHRDFPINGRIYIHHMNPMTVGDLTNFNPDVLDPEFLICCSFRTHNAVHYGDEEQLPRPFVPRAPGDTDLWEPIADHLYEGDFDDDQEPRRSSQGRRGDPRERPRHLSEGRPRVVQLPKRRRRRWGWSR